uniref:ATP-binding protein n=1 Tax=Roseovarius indicus TaxID=540747 RepID=UPI003B52E711
MEDQHRAALQKLFMLSLDPDIELKHKVPRLLEAGCEALGLPLGIVSNIDENVYRVIHVVGPDWAPKLGAVFDVSQTYCTHTLVADDVRHFNHAGNSDIATHPCYLEFGLESYIGVPLWVADKRVGTLNFSSSDARHPFTETEVELVRLFGRWLGQEWLKSDKVTELAETSMLLNAVIEAVPDGIVAVGDDRRIRLVNSATEELFGYCRDELVGRSTSILYPSVDEFESRAGLLQGDLAHTLGDRTEMQLRKSDGSVFPGEVFLAPLRDKRNVELGLVGAIRDISDESALKTAREELISNVSHELRTPITSVKGALKLLTLERDKLSEPMQRMLDAAAGNADRLIALLEDLLDVDRLNSSTLAAERREVGLHAVVERAAREIQPFASSHNVTVIVSQSGENSVIVEGDEGRLLQVFSNLLSNAVKASISGGTVEIGTMADRPGVWVRDYGSGIPEHLQQGLFDRFTRAPESYAKGHSSTGLGMSIVKAIVDHHAGEVRFETEQGVGTTFFVTFPPFNSVRLMSPA